MLCLLVVSASAVFHAYSLGCGIHNPQWRKFVILTTVGIRRMVGEVSGSLPVF